MSRWTKATLFVKDLSEWAKLVALLLAIIGFATIYFPGIKRAWEVHFQPAAWYWIGYADGGTFHPLDYQHPLWDDGLPREEALRTLPGQVLITRGDALHIGRVVAGGRGSVRALAGKNVCLHVLAIKELSVAGNVKRFVWADAVKVTC